LPYARPTSHPVGAIVHPGKDLSRKIIDGIRAVDRHRCGLLRAASTGHAGPGGIGRDRGGIGKKERMPAPSTVKTFAPALRASAPAGRTRGVNPVIYLP
jgi:hypothetical protein